MTCATAINDKVDNLPDQFNEIRNVIKTEYLKKHNHPWVIADFGEKESTLLLQLIWEVITDIPVEARKRRILVVGNDSLVEFPLITQHLKESLSVIEAKADSLGLPIETEIAQPCIDQTFWVTVIGRGYVTPTRNFNWCTDRLKIAPTNMLLEQMTHRYRGVILLIGSQRAMGKKNLSPKRMAPYDSVARCRTWTPLTNLSDNDVWTTLLQCSPPWGGTHRRLVNLYCDAEGVDYPLATTTNQTQSCGSLSPRGGCWIHAIVQKENSLEGLTGSGNADTEKMQALFNFSEWLLALRNDDSNRLPVDRYGNTRRRRDGTLEYGSFNLEVRKQILKKLLALETEINEQLILPGEIECIEDIWWRDEIRENARLSLERKLSKNA